MASHRIGLMLLCVATLTYALPATEEARGSRNAIQTENDLLDSIYADCLRKDSISCLKYKLYSFVDKMLGHKDTITVTEGVQIVKTGGDVEGAPRALNGDETIETLIFNRLQRFFESHTIKVELRGSEIVNAVSDTARSFGNVIENYEEEENAIEEGRGKKKKEKKLMSTIMALAALKMALLMKLALAGIALIAGKALLVGKLALVLSAVIGLKKLLGSSQGKHVTYEVVSHPQHSSSHVSSHESAYGSSGSGGYAESAGAGGYSSSGHGGWGRSLDAQKLAYRAHVPATQQ